MHLPFEHSLFSAIDFSTNREAWVPVVMITVILGVLWVIDSSGRNPFSAFPYPYETFVILIPTITLLIPTAAFLYATGGSFRSIRLSSHQLWSAALLGAIAVIVFLVPTIVLSNRFLLGLEKASPLFLFAFAYQAACEEIFFRGFLQTRLEKLFGSLNGLLGTAIIFNLYHVPEEVFVYRLSGGGLMANFSLMLPASMLLGYLALRSDSLLGSSMYHFVYNISLLLTL